MPRKKKPKQQIIGYRPGRDILYRGSTKPYTDRNIKAGTDVVLDMSHLNDDTLLKLQRRRTLIPVYADVTEEPPNGENS